MAIRFAVFGLNQGSKIARDAKKNPDYDLVAVAGFGQQAEDVAAELEVTLVFAISCSKSPLPTRLKRRTRSSQCARRQMPRCLSVIIAVLLRSTCSCAISLLRANWVIWSVFKPRMLLRNLITIGMWNGTRKRVAVRSSSTRSTISTI